MQALDSKKFVALVVAAALAFKWKYDADRAEQEIDISLMSPEKRQAAMEAKEFLPAEADLQEWWPQFLSFVEHSSPERLLEGVNADIDCVASLMRGEPSFTLLGRDMLASMLVKHWIELARQLNAENIRLSKIDKAEGIVAAMEQFKPQKLPD